MNLVYKTYEISTNVEYTSGTRLNLSGVRIIKLINRPSGVQVWISTDSNGTNLFPLINRGDGWELPNDFEPLYNLYVFTKGTNSQDKLILSYTGEKNFFIFGSNSIEKVGEIESLGNKAQIDINNALFNYYSRIPLSNTGKIFEKFYYADFDRFHSGNNTEIHKYITFPISDEMDTIQSLNLLDDKYYRITILGHWDTGSDNNLTEAGGNAWIACSLHLCLFNDDDNDPISFVKLENTTSSSANPKINCLNFYEVNKFPDYKNRFNILGLKSNSGIGSFTTIGNIDLNFDTIISGKTINKYKYIGILFSSESWNNTNHTPRAAMHASLLTTISQAYSNIEGNSFKPIQISKQSYYFAYTGNEKLIVNSTMEKPITSTLLTNIPIESIGIEAFGAITGSDTQTPTFSNPLNGYYGLNLKTKTISYTSTPPSNQCTNGTLYFKLTNKINGDYIGYMIMAATHGSAVNTPAINYQSE